ncbi:hypothetical protein, partial [Tsukamurella sp. 1534]|uniref:hypothetical protein n=1 Tax=Tsukamurella sp. 1534 TaxID=1151061 RepID=UPI001ED98609
MNDERPKDRRNLAWSQVPDGDPRNRAPRHPQGIPRPPQGRPPRPPRPAPPGNPPPNQPPRVQPPRGQQPPP